MSTSLQIGWSDAQSSEANDFGGRPGQSGRRRAASLKPMTFAFEPTFERDPDDFLPELRLPIGHNAFCGSDPQRRHELCRQSKSDEASIASLRNGRRVVGDC